MDLVVAMHKISQTEQKTCMALILPTTHTRFRESATPTGIPADVGSWPTFLGIGELKVRGVLAFTPNGNARRGSPPANQRCLNRRMAGQISLAGPAWIC